jgi:hypothetical protein
MDINTSIGVLTEEEFIKRCNEKSFPGGLTVYMSLVLYECRSLRFLPDRLKVEGSLFLCGCSSLKSLPEGLSVGSTLFVDPVFIEKYSFRDLPKILHLPFAEKIKQILLQRLRNVY